MRHDKIAAAIHWHLSKKYGFQCGEKSYQHFVSKDTLWSLIDGGVGIVGGGGGWKNLKN